MNNPEKRVDGRRMIGMLLMILIRCYDYFKIMFKYNKINSDNLSHNWTCRASRLNSAQQACY